MGTNKETTRQLVVAKVADILCGIGIDAVHEIIPMQEITGVPKAPRNMLGMTNVRGTVIPVADMRGCLGYSHAEIGKDTRIVLVTYGDDKIGLVVDAVAEVITLENEAFQSMKGNVAESSFLRSVARLEDRLILDVDHVRVVDDGLDSAPAKVQDLLREVTEEEPTEDTTEDEANADTLAETLKEEVAEETIEEDAAEDSAADLSEDDATGEETTEPAPEEASDGGLNVELLESSFALLAPKGEELVERFYRRLFETSPAVRNLFPDDMAGQKKALLGTLAAIVGSLRAPEKLAAHLRELGQRHVTYGAVLAHYDVVAQVLLATMAELAGDAWNDEIQSAWLTALTAIKDLMLSAVEPSELAA
jgi:chemotaxis signal transduction protein/hemoglobin-like flavoprotein